MIVKILVIVFLWFLLWPVPAAWSNSCKVFAIESPEEDNEFNSNAVIEVLASGQQPVRDYNLSNVATKIENHMQNIGCDCISELVLVGHGQTGKFSMGCGAYKDCQDNEFIGIDNQVQWEPVMEQLGKLMCNGLISQGIKLYGCQVGICQESSQLLHNLAKKSNHVVYAPTKTVMGSKLFEEIEDTDYWQYGLPGAPAPQPCRLGKTLEASNLKRGAHTYYRCYCDGKLYDSITECVDNCHASLACITPYCDPVYINTYMDKADLNPVITGGGSESKTYVRSKKSNEEPWDAGGVSTPTVIREVDGYKMWFTGYDLTNTYWRIGLATSNYGDTWSKYEKNPVLSHGSEGSWDDEGVYNPCVIKDGEIFKMWYHGFDGSYSRIGYATSFDGINWTKHKDNPVLSEGGSGEPDEIGVGEPVVIKENGDYKMWYGCYDGWYWRVCHACSTDGIIWEKHLSNPVLSENPDWEAWDGGGLGGPAVVRINNNYVMFFGGRDWYNTNVGIGRAISYDGVNWTRDDKNPFFCSDPSSAWESAGMFHPTLLVDENQNLLYVWYRGSNGSDFAIGLASTPLYTMGSGLPWIFLLLE